MENENGFAIFIEEISDKLTQLERILNVNEIENVNITFPRGVIRRAQHYRDKLPFIIDDILSSNIAYHLMLNNLYRWLFNRFDIDLTLKEMLVKAAIINYGNIIDAIIRPIAKAILLPERKKIGFDAATTILVKRRLLTKTLQKKIKKIWNIRCKQHVETERWEYQKYSLEDFNLTEEVFEQIIIRLTNIYEKGQFPKKYLNMKINLWKRI